VLPSSHLALHALYVLQEGINLQASLKAETIN
jgi:hypothetical protein